MLLLIGVGIPVSPTIETPVLIPMGTEASIPIVAQVLIPVSEPVLTHPLLKSVNMCPGTYF